MSSSSTFRKGDVISNTIISDFFQNLYIKINDITHLQIDSLTTGQFIDETIETIDGDLIFVEREELNTASDQFFDDMEQGDVNYLQYYLDQVQLIESR